MVTWISVDHFAMFGCCYSFSLLPNLLGYTYNIPVTVGAMGRMAAGAAGATGQRGEPGAGVAHASYDQGLLGNLRLGTRSEQEE